MAKHFYFAFYPKDFITATVGMRAEEVGAYIRLLCYQFENGAIPIDDIDTLSIIAGSKQLDKVLLKFPGGVNKKLDRVKEQGQYLQAIRSEAGSKGGSKTQAKHKQNSSNDGNININSNIKSNSNSYSNREGRHFVPPTLQEVIDFRKEHGQGTDPQRFIDFYSSKGWMVGRAPMKDWKAAYRRSAEWDKDKQSSGFDIMKWVPKEMRDKGVSQ